MREGGEGKHGHVQSPNTEGIRPSPDHTRPQPGDKRLCPPVKTSPPQPTGEVRGLVIWCTTSGRPAQPMVEDGQRCRQSPGTGRLRPQDG